MENLVCPKCKHENIKKGSLATSFEPVQMFPEQKRGTSSPISAEYCHNCGYILSFYVDKPENVQSRRR